MAKWAVQHGLPAPHPWMWDAQSLARWQPVGTDLAGDTRDALHRLDDPLADALLDAGYTLEQETVTADLAPADITALTRGRRA